MFLIGCYVFPQYRHLPLDEMPIKSTIIHIKTKYLRGKILATSQAIELVLEGRAILIMSEELAKQGKWTGRSTWL